MPRPDFIAAIHAAKYDLRWCDGSEKPAKLKAYHQALERASMQLGISVAEIKAAIVGDFGPWMRENGLPKPPIA